MRDEGVRHKSYVVSNTSTRPPHKLPTTYDLQLIRTTMAGTAFVEQLKSKFGDKVSGANFENLDPWIEVTPEGLLDVMRHLRDEPSLAFDYLNCVSGVDYLHTDEKKAAKSARTLSGGAICCKAQKCADVTRPRFVSGHSVRLDPARRPAD